MSAQQGPKVGQTQGASTQAPTNESLLQQLAESQAMIAKLLANQARVLPRRRKTLREFLKERPQKRLIRPVFQNGREVNPAGLSDETIKRLDTVATGIYGNGMLNVIRLTDGLHSRIHIMYSNKSIEQRMAFYMQFPSFTSIVNTVVSEMKARGVEPINEPPPPGSVEPEPEEDDDNQ
jgi:hypothetical protein